VITGYIPLDYGEVALAATLLVLNAVLSYALELRLERQLIVAALRMTMQLLLVGLVLNVLFELASPWLTAAVALSMAAFAGHEIMARQERRLRGWWAYGLGASTMMLAAAVVTVLGLATQIRPDPWYDPRYAISLFGMILGNAMTGISLGLNGLTTAAARERVAIEAQLILGATRWQAMRPVSRQALRSGFMPIINAMAATGVVALPGMMTGQILAGVDPTQAVKYQLLIMFLIAGATGFGVLLAVLGGVWRLTDERHRLRLDRLGSSDRRRSSSGRPSLSISIATRQCAGDAGRQCDPKALVDVEPSRMLVHFLDQEGGTCHAAERGTERRQPDGPTDVIVASARARALALCGRIPPRPVPELVPSPLALRVGSPWPGVARLTGPAQGRQPRATLSGSGARC
jgi:putative ABC transport system permease protein